MAGLTLYHCTRSRSMRCLWTIYELGLPCTLVTLPFPPRVHRRDYVKEVNPLGTVPCLIDASNNNAKLTESVGICEYLVERHGPPKSPLIVRREEDGDANRAIYLDHMFKSDSHLTTPVTVVFRYSKLEPDERKSPQVVEDNRQLFLFRLEPLNALLGSSDYICAGRFTLADIWVTYALVIAQSQALDYEFPNIKRYYQNISERPAFQRAFNT